VNDTKLREIASPRQLEYLDGILAHGSARAAAKALGVSYGTLGNSLASLRKKAARALGHAPGHFDSGVAPGYLMGKVTIHRDADGVIKNTWERQSPGEISELLQEAVEAFMADLPALAAPSAPLDFQTDIIPWIQIGDAHIGMLAHASEVGESFDLAIAERELCASIAILIDELPNCERIVINDLGDATHYDNMSATTAASGHALDADGRIFNMIRTYSRVMRFIVDKALQKAQHVDVIINQGNHSRVNDFWMREMLSVAYGHTGRVHVLDNDSVFIGYRMGNTLVMTHHSDKCPPARLVGVLTTDFRKDFGETEFHYIDVGHVHHHFVSKEHPSVVIESWNHLAPNDKWAHEAGYRSRKSITVALRSRKYGDVGRRVLPVEEIKARLLAAFGGKAQAKKVTYSV